MFVGRAGELAVLEAAAAAARRGQPQVVLVEGEAGTGKSSLLAQFAAGLAGAAVLRASGDEAELLLPYGLVAMRCPALYSNFQRVFLNHSPSCLVTINSTRMGHDLDLTRRPRLTWLHGRAHRSSKQQGPRRS